MGNGKAEKGNLWCSIKSLKKALKNQKKLSIFAPALEKWQSGRMRQS